MWPPIFFLAICLGYAYERTGSLWTSIVMHSLFNATSTYLFLNQGQ
jgi:membrane protease YdiL (CAAX protease family)